MRFQCESSQQTEAGFNAKLQRDARNREGMWQTIASRWFESGHQSGHFDSLRTSVVLSAFAVKKSFQNQLGLSSQSH